MPMPRRNKTLRHQARNIIYQVHNYLKKEAEEGVKNVKQVQQRTAEATGTSVRTVQTILKESRKSTELVPKFRTPGKKRPRKGKVTGLDNFEEGAVKRCIHNFHITNKELPTVKKIHEKLQEDINFKGSRSSLHRVIFNQGFRWRKSEINKKVLIEKSDIRLQRIEYIEKINAYRNEDRNIVYTDETYVHSSALTTSTLWLDGSQEGLKPPISKGQRVILVHALTESGFIPGALLMFKSGIQSGEFQDNMNCDNYEKWLTTKLLPNLKPNSVIVLDNASYHNKLTEVAPSSNAKKADMIAWLYEKEIPFSSAMLKPQLYKLISLHKDRYKKYYSIDNIIKSHGHTVLRIPPNHSDLNAIEMAWTAIKEYVAQYALYNEWNVSEVMDLIRAKCEEFGSSEWEKMTDEVKRIEAEYMESDYVIDTLTEDLIISTSDVSDSESSNSENSEDGDCTSDEESPTPSKKYLTEKIFLQE